LPYAYIKVLAAKIKSVEKTLIIGRLQIKFHAAQHSITEKNFTGSNNK
jgi:hypothetical protein